MTRKHFTAIAATIAASTVTANLTATQREDLAYEFGKLCKRENERFDAARFFDVCSCEHWAEMAAQLNEGWHAFDPAR